MRVALFFDGKNFFRSLQKHDPTLEVDYEALATWITEHIAGANGRFVGAYYYTGYNKGGGGPRGEAFGKFLRSLEYRRGFFVRREPRVRRRQKVGAKVRYFWTEKRVDTRLVSDMIQLAAVDAYDCAVLFSGDQDFIPAVEAARELGKQVWLAHWAGGGVSKELRRQCFDEVDCAKYTQHIGTGRPRSSSFQSISSISTTETIKQVKVVETTTEGHTIIVSEVTKGHAYFAAIDGHLSEWFFINKWNTGEDCPPRSSDEREKALAAAVDAGLIATYEYEDSKGRPTRGLKPTKDS